MRKILTRVGLCIFSLIFAVLIFEGMLRLFTPKPQNLAKLQSSNLFLYENKPGASFVHASGEDGYRNKIVFNSSGFRDTDFSLDKNADTVRIAVIGDSYEEALQLPLEDTWQKVMQSQLSSTKQVEVYNFGVSGYGTDQEWLTLREKVWKFKPDIVILAFTANDLGDVYKNNLVYLKDGRLTVRGAGERAGGNVLGKFARQTYFYHFLTNVSALNPYSKQVFSKLRTKVLGFATDDRFFLSDAQLIQGPFEVIASQKNPPPAVLSTWEVVKALIADMQKQANEHSAKFVVTTNINKSRISEVEWKNLQEQYKLNVGESSSSEIINVLNGYLNSAGITFFDPYQQGWTLQPQRCTFHGDCSC
ncbi:SGNH/GDSL hydrolase family protein [Candidatus Curtissbacteria bacterium]|nr:SGNH/GDSL hydrolase family protein [Candidatus Curtissbacteria bacterium]